MPKITLTSPKTGKTIVLTPPKPAAIPKGYKGIDMYKLAKTAKKTLT